MDKTISISKDDLVEYWNQLVDYFSGLETDEQAAYGSIGGGFVFFIAGLFLL